MVLRQSVLAKLFKSAVCAQVPAHLGRHPLGDEVLESVLEVHRNCRVDLAHRYIIVVYHDLFVGTEYSHSRLVRLY